MKNLVLRFVYSYFFIILSISFAWADVNPKPFVIPELTSWEGQAGRVSFSGNVIVRSRKLQKVAQQFAADYETMFGKKVRISDGTPKAGDLVLELVKDEQGNYGEEGYVLDLKKNITLKASTAKAIYWGTRTLLQLTEQSADLSLPCGKTIDVPQYQFRGFMIDVGRKFVPMSYLHTLVKVMSYYKMNVLQIHLNDNGFVYYFNNDWSKTSSGFRIESETFPGLARKGASYTKKQFIDFQIMAEQYGVEIIPEIDVPAHSLAFTHYKPELATPEYGMDHLDIFKPETYEFIDALFKEYLEGENPVFRGKRVNIGTDEYSNKTEVLREKFRYFTDRYIRYVESFGKEVCLWGSLKHAYGKTPVKSEGVTMMCWSDDFADSEQLKKDGYRLVSIPDRYVYIVPGAGYYYDYLNGKYLYEKWTPAVTGKKVLPDRDPAILGGMFAVWNDHYGNGISVKDIHHRIMPAIQVLSTKMWTAHVTSLPYELFSEQQKKISEAPGVNELGRYAEKDTLIYQATSIKPSQVLPLEDIGYDYTVEFTLDLKEEMKGTELFCSKDAVFYLSDPQKGRVGFARDGYLNIFRYTLPKEGKVTLAISGTNKETMLYVNGKLYETLAVQTYIGSIPEAQYNHLYDQAEPFTPVVYNNRYKMFYHATLFFPLRTAGEFNSSVSSIKVYNYLKYKERK